jgi:hypothetical protein
VEVALAAAAAAAARPSGLASELPGEVAEATAASQLRDTRVSAVAEPLLFGGGGTDRSRWLETTQSVQASWSPTVVDTTGLNPAEFSAELASLYFWPTTLGEDLAAAAPAQARLTAATKPPTSATSTTFLVTRLLQAWVVVPVTDRL